MKNQSPSAHRHSNGKSEEGSYSGASQQNSVAKTVEEAGDLKQPGKKTKNVSRHYVSESLKPQDPNGFEETLFTPLKSKSTSDLVQAALLT